MRTHAAMAAAWAVAATVADCVERVVRVVVQV